MIVFILAVLAFLGLVAMALSVVNAYVNPQHFIWTTVFGLAFWEILIFNVAVFLLLLLMWSNKIWISVVALLIAIPGIAKSFSFGSKAKAESSIRIMSYNVHNFKHIDGETGKEEFANHVMDMVREQAPDILCCQEFSGFKSGVTRPQCIAKVTEDSGFGKENTYGVMVSVDAGEKGKFHVANVHLLSYNITDNEIDIITNSSERQEKLDTIGKTVLYKLKYAFEKRSDELKQVMEGMPPVGGPVLVCGDFNEPPLSYNYRQMQKAGFIDTFTKVGFGIKSTYAGKLPLLRIDYIWANDDVKPLDFERHKYKASDHYPIILDFAIK